MLERGLPWDTQPGQRPWAPKSLGTVDAKQVRVARAERWKDTWNTADKGLLERNLTPHSPLESHLTEPGGGRWRNLTLRGKPSHHGVTHRKKPAHPLLHHMDPKQGTKGHMKSSSS
jgi:hypothetical protein